MTDDPLVVKLSDLHDRFWQLYQERHGLGMTTLLTRDQIMQANDLRRELVAVPEWGGDVLVKTLTGRERDAFEASIAGERQGKRVKLDLENIRARFVAACVVDEKGQPLFYPSDVALLGEKSAAALQRVFEVGQRLSGLSDGDVEELAGN